MICWKKCHRLAKRCCMDTKYAIVLFLTYLCDISKNDGCKIPNGLQVKAKKVDFGHFCPFSKAPHGILLVAKSPHKILLQIKFQWAQAPQTSDSFNWGLNSAPGRLLLHKRKAKPQKSHYCEKKPSNEKSPLFFMKQTFNFNVNFQTFKVNFQFQKGSIKKIFPRRRIF